MRYELLIDGRRRWKAASEADVRRWLAEYREEHAEDDPDAAHVQVRQLSALSWLTGGKLLDDKASSVSGSPSYSGRYEGGLARQVKAGDVIINPPGTVHSWKSIDSPRLVYMNVWIDPEKRLQAGYVDPVLKKKPTQ